MFECSICHVEFKKRYDLKVHQFRHTGNFPYKCDFCPKGYPNKQEFDIHRNTHLGIKPFVCHLCPKKFSQRPHLTSHLRIHTGDKPFKCTLCPKQFTQSSHLRTHHLHHTGEKPFKCSVCGDCFRLSSTLKCHMRIHTGEKPYKCHKCNIRFSQTTQLYYHTAKEHPSSKDKPYPFSCTKCGKGFYVKQFWKDHERGACGVTKIFTCLFCQSKGAGKFGRKFTIFKFSYERDLEHHLRKHTQETPYFCQFCELCFINDKAKRYHMRIHLNGEEKAIRIKQLANPNVFQCQFCHHSFDERERFEGHLKRNHASKLDNDHQNIKEKKETNKLFKVRMEQINRRLNRRLKFKCAKCSSAFQTENGRSLHAKIVHEGIVGNKCDFCWKIFPTDDKLKWHVSLEHVKSESDIKCDLISVKVEKTEREDDTVEIFDNIMPFQ